MPEDVTGGDREADDELRDAVRRLLKFRYEALKFPTDIHFAAKRLPVAFSGNTSDPLLRTLLDNSLWHRIEELVKC